MGAFTIILGNKNYSSWSLRAWLVLKQTGAEFDEVVVPLDTPRTQAAIQAWSQAGKVPVLRHGTLIVWDSMAIAEYLAEMFPESGLWPSDAQARATARAAAAEMHSGFAALRRALPMDVRARQPRRYDSAVAADIARICALWSHCRTRFAADGPFLFGDFNIADAFYAPVVSRFATYSVDLPKVAHDYVAAVMDHPAMQEWHNSAAQEPWTIEDP